jgi:hypothetical protein
VHWGGGPRWEEEESWRAREDADAAALRSRSAVLSRRRRRGDRLKVNAPHGALGEARRSMEAAAEHPRRRSSGEKKTVAVARACSRRGRAAASTPPCAAVGAACLHPDRSRGEERRRGRATDPATGSSAAASRGRSGGLRVSPTSLARGLLVTTAGHPPSSARRRLSVRRRGRRRGHLGEGGGAVTGEGGGVEAGGGAVTGEGRGRRRGGGRSRRGGEVAGRG